MKIVDQTYQLEYKLLEYPLYPREDSLRDAEEDLNTFAKDGWEPIHSIVHIGKDPMTGNMGSRVFTLVRRK